jgi:hypothetical protein
MYSMFSYSTKGPTKRSKTCCTVYSLPPSIGESGSMIEQASSSIDGPNMTIVNINQAARHKKRPVLQDREGLHALEGPRGAAGVF